MKDKVYHLCVELTIDGQKQIITLAKGNLLALEKYTSFCNGPLELLRTMPDKETFSSKDFLDRYLTDVNYNNDPFSIRTSNAKGSRKLPLLYKKDDDILFTNKEEIIENIRDNYKFKIEDVLSDRINEKTKNLLKELWSLFYETQSSKYFYDYIDKKLNPDKAASFDKRYEIVLSNRWMILGLSKTFLEEFIKLIYKSPRKRIELLYYLKQNYSHIIPNIDSLEKQKRLGLLEKELSKKKINVSKIRKQINENLSEFNLSLIPPVPEKTIEKPDIMPYQVTREEIILYNEKRTDLTPIMERILKLSKELENLQRELLVTRSIEIKKKIEERIVQIEFEIYELENNRYCYTDNGELIKEDEMLK